MWKLKIENSNKSELIKEFSSKQGLLNALKELNKQGFLKVTAGWYYNKETKQFAFSSIQYYI